MMNGDDHDARLRAAVAEERLAMAERALAEWREYASALGERCAVAEAAAAEDPLTRSEKLAHAFSYRNRSGLSHEKVLRVLVQFMDPLDLTADFVAAVKGEPDVNTHLVLKKDRAEVPLLSEAGKTRARFAPGSTLTD